MNFGGEMGVFDTRNEARLLTCWKDIAQYMGKGVRTVQRWEQTLDLPVQRPRGNAHKSAVLARANDLDKWLESRWTRRSPENGSSGPGRRNGSGELDNTIQAAHRLRAANHSLMDEVRSELNLLVRNCDQMMRRGMPEPEATRADEDHLAVNHFGRSAPRDRRSA
jgi:hypothetical protein